MLMKNFKLRYQSQNKVKVFNKRLGAVFQSLSFPLSFGAGPLTTALSAFGAGHSASPLRPSGTLATALSAFGAGHSGSPRSAFGYHPQHLRRRHLGYRPQRLRAASPLSGFGAGALTTPQRLRHRPLGSVSEFSTKFLIFQLFSIFHDFRFFRFFDSTFFFFSTFLFY